MVSPKFILLTSAVLATAAFSLSIPTTCSPTLCGTYGSTTICHSSAGLITCAKYAKTKEGIISCKKHPATCNKSCYFIPVYDSDGNPHCTPCHLHAYSCKVGYKVHGPVSHPTSAAQREAKAEEAEVEDGFSVRAANPSLAPQAKFAHPTVPVPTCSMEFCTLRGASAACRVGRITATCKQFAFTPESKKQCAFFCPQICLPNGPIASNGQKFCSVCHLRQASCRSFYKIFGPVLVATTARQPTVKPISTKKLCSKNFCTSSGARAKCIFRRRYITCGIWAKTPAKKEECAFACPLICLPEDLKPIDNTGRKHCSVCILQSASCAANFKIFGPVQRNPPTDI